MKMHARQALILASTLTLALAVWLPAQAVAADMGNGAGMMGGKTLDRCEEMKGERQKMMDDCKAEDAKLTDQLEAMNKATPDNKMNLMAAVITTMGEQQISMDARRSKMDAMMMRHVMWHMLMGKDTIATCPMMQDMPGMKNPDEMKDMKGMKDGSDDKAKAK